LLYDDDDDDEEEYDVALLVSIITRSVEMTSQRCVDSIDERRVRTVVRRNYSQAGYLIFSDCLHWCMKT